MSAVAAFSFALSLCATCDPQRKREAANAKEERRGEGEGAAAVVGCPFVLHDLSLIVAAPTHTHAHTHTHTHMHTYTHNPAVSLARSVLPCRLPKRYSGRRADSLSRAHLVPSPLRHRPSARPSACRWKRQRRRPTPLPRFAATTLSKPCVLVPRRLAPVAVLTCPVSASPSPSSSCTAHQQFELRTVAWGLTFFLSPPCACCLPHLTHTHTQTDRHDAHSRAHARLPLFTPTSPPACTAVSPREGHYLLRRQRAVMGHLATLQRCVSPAL